MAQMFLDVSRFRAWELESNQKCTFFSCVKICCSSAPLRLVSEVDDGYFGDCGDSCVVATSSVPEPKLIARRQLGELQKNREEQKSSEGLILL